MQDSRNINAVNSANSYHDWWQMAGVDYAVGNETHDWLAVAEKPEPTKPQYIQSESVAKPEIILPKKLTIAADAWPSDLAMLKQALLNCDNFPGNNFGGKSLSPLGDMGSELMIIGDLPDGEEMDSGQFCTGKIGKLFSNIVRSLGFQLDDCFITALAMTRPATGALPDYALAELAEFMRHQIKIVQPKAIILFGSTAAQALLGVDLMAARGNLHYFTHNDRKVKAITTFHPRTLLARPLLKVEAWKDLQVFANKG